MPTRKLGRISLAFTWQYPLARRGVARQLTFASVVVEWGAVIEVVGQRRSVGEHFAESHGRRVVTVRRRPQAIL